MKLFNKYYIDTKSFFRKGIKKKDEPFGVFIITGRMGTGKSYFAVKWCYENYTSYKIKTNIKSLKINDRDIEYFDNLSSIYNDNQEYTIYIIDELGKKFTKENKSDKDFYNFLQMSRKTKRIVFIIHQEYLQVPIWIRGVASEIITTKKAPILPIFITYKGFPYLDENMEWQVEYNTLYIYKRNKKIANLYNTFETVNTL